MIYINLAATEQDNGRESSLLSPQEESAQFGPSAHGLFPIVLAVALEDYCKKVPDADSGVPLNYYLKDITKGILAEMWAAKYFPNKNSIQDDDETKQKTDA